MNLDKLQSAVELAFEAHRDQWRDGEVPVPYICHPLEVLTTLRNIGKVTDIDQLCAAVLHDVAEESEIGFDRIREVAGEGTEQLVRELTRVEPTEEQKAGLSPDEIWALRTKWLLEEIAAMSPRAQEVKMCDRISNLREAKLTKSDKKVKRYMGQTVKILEIIPKKTNPALWSILAAEAKSPK